MPKPVNRTTRREGNVPANGQLIGEHPTGWRLYLYKVQTTGIPGKKKPNTWLSLKLISTYPRIGKANYWLSYNVTKLDWRLTRDVLELQAEQKDLHLWAERCLIASQCNDYVTALDKKADINDIL